MTHRADDIDIWGLIPAAGLSRRMGRPKQTLPLRGSTMLAGVTRTVLGAGVRGVVVVTRSELRLALDLPDDARVHIVINDAIDTEMIDSIRIGLARIDQLASGGSSAAGATPTGVLVVPGDMPTLLCESCLACIDVFAQDTQRIVIATHAGRRGHPMIFPLSLRPSINCLEAGLRELAQVHPHRVRHVETTDQAVIFDMDTAADYHHACLRVGSPVDAADLNTPVYECEFECIPGDVTSRTPRVTTRPVLRGTQTARVVSPASEEIHTDPYGRVKLRFHWNREGQFNEHSSCWERGSRGSAGGPHGMMFTPHIGQDVIVDLPEGDSDKPVVIGRTNDGDHMPPYTLPADKTKSCIKTNSSKGGGGSNEIRRSQGK